MGAIIMEEFIVKHAKDLKDVAFFVLCVYLIWSDRQDRKEDRKLWEVILEKILNNKEKE